MTDLDRVFTDNYLQVYDPSKKVLEIRRKSRAEGNLSLKESMDLISVLLREWQTYYIPNTYDRNVLFFPYAFRELKEGDRIFNKTTGETYTIDQVIVNPQSNKWEGVVKITSVNVPNPIDREILEFQNDARYVDFDHAYRVTPPNEISTNESGDGLSPPPMRPVISWTLARQEPGVQSGKAFGPNKVLKPTIREILKDPQYPGYSVSVLGQYFDNIVQFDALYIDNSSAESLVEWFNNFLTKHRPVLQQNGVAQLYYSRRLEDVTDQRWRQPIWKRTIQWYFRTEQLTAIYERDLLWIETSLSIASSISIRQSPRYIADQLTSGDLTASGYHRLFYDRSGNYLFGDIDIRQ